LSPRIAELRRSDNTICGFFIETADPKGEFCRFLSLGQGESISIDLNDRLFSEELSEGLKNSELFDVLLEGRGDSITIDEEFSRPRPRSRLIFECSREIDLLPSHFNEINLTLPLDLDISVFSAILGSKGLKTQREDSLCKQIWAIIKRDRKHFALLEFVVFEYVSRDVAGRFIASGHAFLDPAAASTLMMV
jgi:hypothetical protein